MQELKRQVGARGRARPARRSKQSKRHGGPTSAPALPELDVRYRLRVHDDSLVGLDEALASAGVLDYEQEARILAEARRRQQETAGGAVRDGAGTESNPPAEGGTGAEREAAGTATSDSAGSRRTHSVEAPVGADGTVGEPVPV